MYVLCMGGRYSCAGPALHNRFYTRLVQECFAFLLEARDTGYDNKQHADCAESKFLQATSHMIVLTSTSTKIFLSLGWVRCFLLIAIDLGQQAAARHLCNRLISLEDQTWFKICPIFLAPYNSDRRPILSQSSLVGFNPTRVPGVVSSAIMAVSDPLHDGCQQHLTDPVDYNGVGQVYFVLFSPIFAPTQM